MCRNGFMSFTDSFPGSHDDDWTGGVGLDMLQAFRFPYILMDLGPVQILSAWVLNTSREKSSVGGVSLHMETAVRLLVGHRSVVGLFKVVWRCTHFCFVFPYGVSFVYSRLWKLRGSAPQGGDELITVRIRHSPIPRDSSRAGSVYHYSNTLLSLQDCQR